MHNLTVLNSSIDASVNFVETQLTGFLESRYVRKCDDYFICYLSSQSGCNRGCRFCHLTATGQTRAQDATKNDIIDQASAVLRHYKGQKPAKYVHYNFMARGEALASDTFIQDADRILWQLGDMAASRGLGAKFNVSTIIPRTFKKSLRDVFKVIHPTIYYSLYSARGAFRDKWMPGAASVETALTLLKDYQDYSKKIVKIHHTFIRGENDSEWDVRDMCELVLNAGLAVEFNLVRYNPASPAQGEESSESVLQSNLQIIEEYFSGKVQMIPRVGLDVKASCGMFVQ